MKKDVKKYYVKYESDYLNERGAYSKKMVLMNQKKAKAIKSDYEKNDCGGVKIYKID